MAIQLLVAVTRPTSFPGRTHSEMTTDQTPIRFHEASLTGIVRRGTSVELDLVEVRIDNIPKNVKVTVDGVSSVLRDGLPVSDLAMEQEDGEVLSLRKEDGQVVLAVEWNDFAARLQRTVVYLLRGSNIAMYIAPVI